MNNFLNKRWSLYGERNKFSIYYWIKQLSTYFNILDFVCRRKLVGKPRITSEYNDTETVLKKWVYDSIK